MTARASTKSPLSPIEMERLFDALSDEGREILTTQMLALNYLTTTLQQLHIEILERIDKGEKIEPEAFGGLCISFSDEKAGETWSRGIGASEPVCNAFMGTFNAAWKELPEEVFEAIISMAKEKEDIGQEEKKEEKKKKKESPVVDLEKWKVDNQWKN
jgi:hypothetical protein